MTMYARSDLSATNLSAAHGGCGQIHTRPAPGGEPVTLWALTCPQCETHLRTDPLWSSTVSEIPETHDEQSDREDWAKRGAHDLQYIQAMAAAKQVGLEIPETMIRALMGKGSNIFPASGEMICRNDHANPPGMDFCGKCGVSMREAAPTASLPAGEPAGREAPPAPRPPDAPSRDLADLHPQKLRKMCREKGLDDSGTRPEMLARLAADRKVAA